MSSRVRELQEHLFSEESVLASRPVKVPSLTPPPSLAAPPPATPEKVQGVVEYRERMALEGEKQFLADMQLTIGSLNTRLDTALATTALDGLEAQLTKVEEAQRARDLILGIKPSTASN